MKENIDKREHLGVLKLQWSEEDKMKIEKNSDNNHNHADNATTIAKNSVCMLLKTKTSC